MTEADGLVRHLSAETCRGRYQAGLARRRSEVAESASHRAANSLKTRVSCASPVAGVSTKYVVLDLRVQVADGADSAQSRTRKSWASNCADFLAARIGGISQSARDLISVLTSCCDDARSE